MKANKSLLAKWLLLTWIGASFAGGYAQNVLISVKKGNRGDKSWAVFTFSQKAMLVGVSQSDMGKLSLYLWGNVGSLEGSVITLDQAFDRSILIKQAHSSIIRADVINSSGGPVSILKKDGNIVVAFNDERLLDGSTLLYGETAGIPGKAIALIPALEEDRVTATIQFDGSFDWIGFVRSSPDAAYLFVRGADLAADRNALTFDRGTLGSIRLTGMQGEISGFKTELIMTPNTALNIVRKASEMVVQATGSDSNVAIQLASTDTEKPATNETTPAVSEPLASTPASVGEKPLEPKVESAESQENADTIPWNRIVSFEFRSTPIRDALQLVASTNSINMVITEGVKGAVTMKLENVTLRQALDKIINTQKCNYSVDANIITVKPVDTEYTGGRITKVYRLKYAEAVNVAKVIKRIATEDSLVEVFRPEFLDFAEAGKNRMAFSTQLVQGIRRSSVLVVTDRPEKIQEIDQVIRELDRPPAQIFIESKMVQMSPTTTNKLGINWDETMKMAYSSLPGGNRGLLLYNGAYNDAEGGFFGMQREWQTGRLTRNEYWSLLDFLQQKTDAKLLLNPRIIAMDNEESIISIGQTVPIAQIQRGSGGTSDMVTFTYREVSIRLNVTPHVMGNGEITMYINPVIEEITEWKSLMGNDAPVTDKRSVNSIVTVKNGETVVIGGLIKNSRIKKMKKVWFLGNLPLFGRLFQWESEDEVQTDVMIFITPNIVES